MKQENQPFKSLFCNVSMLLLFQSAGILLYAANGDKLWSSDGEVVTEETGDQKNFDACSDGSGGVFVVWQSDANYDGLWNIYVQRLNADGDQVWASPVLLSNAGVNTQKPAIDSIGVTSFGAFVTFNKSNAGNEDIVAQYIFRAMTYIPGQGFTFYLELPWGNTAVTISDDTRDETAYSIAVDSGNNALIAWFGVDPAAALSSQIRVQKINIDGVCQWTDNGVIVLNSTVATWRTYASYVSTTIISDGSGGAIAAWNDWRNDPSASGNDDIYGQRVFSAGTIAWTANGIAIRSQAGTQRHPKMVSDGNGGGVITWEDHTAFGPDIWAARLNGDSTQQWSKIIIQDGDPFGDSGGEQREPQVVLDLVNNPCPPGSIILWTDTRTESGDYCDILAQKVETTLDFPVGDFDYTGCENLKDFAIFSKAWLSESAEANWNTHCDISSPTDGVIDLLDLAVFTGAWLTCECPYNENHKIRLKKKNTMPGNKTGEDVSVYCGGITT